MKYAIFGEEKFAIELKKQLVLHEYNEDCPDYVFSLGGDGTVLRAVGKYINCNPTFIGINMGRLGFYTDFEFNEIGELIKKIENKNYHQDYYSLLDYELFSNKEVFSAQALNELALVSPVHTHIVEVYIDNVHFETFRGTGFIVSTPSGSTAYNKSCGGSVMDPKLEAIQLTEVASINNRLYKTLASPIIFAKETIVDLVGDFDSTYISVDGIQLNKEKINKIRLRLSNKKARFITREHYNFWDRVKKSFLE